MALTFLSGPMTNTERTVALSAAVRPFAVWPASSGQHVVGLRDLELGIRDHRVADRGALRLLYVLRPLLVIPERVDADPDDLAVALLELRRDPGHVAELGGAHRREVLRMGEQGRPAVADPLVELDGPLRGVRGEVRSLAVDPQRHDAPPCAVNG